MTASVSAKFKVVNTIIGGTNNSNSPSKNPYNTEIHPLLIDSPNKFLSSKTPEIITNSVNGENFDQHGENVTMQSIDDEYMIFHSTTPTANNFNNNMRDRMIKHAIWLAIISIACLRLGVRITTTNSKEIRIKSTKLYKGYHFENLYFLLRDIFKM